MYNYLKVKPWDKQSMKLSSLQREEGGKIARNSPKDAMQSGEDHPTLFYIPPIPPPSAQISLTLGYFYLPWMTLDFPKHSTGKKLN